MEVLFAMSVKKELFGTLDNGKEVYKYWLENKNGMKASVINYGAILVNLLVPDSKGEAKDVVLGYDTLEEYEDNDCFFGAVIGPNANRIGNASFEIDGVKYNVDVNDGPNNLHSHMDDGYHKMVWDVDSNENSVTFTLFDKDGNMGFPGNKKISVTYLLSDDNELQLTYQGCSDKNTIINLTNHSYFNLDGHDAGEMLDHKLILNASAYTPIVKGAIPTGEIASVLSTPFDFLNGKVIRDDIDTDNEQLGLTGGFDHNWVIDNADGTLKKIATVSSAKSGRCMDVFSTLPGVQFYAGNAIREQKGKDGVVYRRRNGLCLETQYYPDSINKANFPSCVFGPDRIYVSTTIYKFYSE